jgi:hypothetical protein
LSFTVASMPAAGVYYRYGADGTAVSDANVQLAADGAGIIQLHLWTASSLGAGTYTDHFRFEVCADSQCSQEVRGSPANLTVTYTVTGNANPATTYVLSAPVPVAIRAYSTDSAPSTAKFGVTISEAPHIPLYQQFTERPISGRPALGATLTYTANGPNDSTITVSLPAPGSKALGVNREDVEFKLCFDSACTRTVPGGPATFTVDYEVIASEGREYSVRKLQGLGARYVASDEIGQKLYVTVADSTGAKIVQIDPATGAIGGSAPLPYEAAGIALSADGSFAYVPLVFGSVVHRFNLPSLNPDVAIAIPAGEQAQQVQVGPAAANVIAVSKSGGGGLPSGVSIYDGTSMRVKQYTGAAYPANSVSTTIAWVADQSSLLALDNDHQDLHIVLVGPDGTQTASVERQTGLRGEIQFFDGLVYAGNGGVFDLAAHTSKPSLADSGFYYNIAVDNQSKLAFFPLFSPESSLVRVNILDPAKRARVLLPQASLANARPVRWGSNGLAFADYNGVLYILQGNFFVP